MDFKPTRERRRGSVTSLQSENRLTQGGVITSSSTSSLGMVDLGYIMDRNNPVRLLDLPAAGGLDIGGPLLSLQVTHDFPIVSEFVSSGPKFGSNYYEVYGPIIAYPTVYNSSSTDLKGAGATFGLDPEITRIGLGATAISRCKPASPEASFGVFLAETYREGIPRLLSNYRDIAGQVDYFRSLGSNYLNVEFGWKPFVADIRKTARAIQNSDRILKDLRRNSGKSIRRQYEFPETRQESVYSTANIRPWPGMNSYTLSQSGRTVTLISTKKTWFSGEFTYRYPPVDDPFPSRVLAGSRQLLGLDLTPETLWNVAPWTWLTDWFANTGDIMSNVSAISSDDLVMRYGYLMQEASQVYRHVHTGVTTPVGRIPRTIVGTTRYVAKSRIAASPYGFGLKFGDLSLRQSAILAAIGITRRGRQ